MALRRRAEACHSSGISRRRTWKNTGLIRENCPVSPILGTVVDENRRHRRPVERYFSDGPYPRHLRALKSAQVAGYAGAVTEKTPVGAGFYLSLHSTLKHPGDQGAADHFQRIFREVSIPRKQIHLTRWSLTLSSEETMSQ